MFAADWQALQNHSVGRRLAEVFAVDKATKTSLKLNVFILQRQDFSVDFRFPFALDGNDKKYRLSTLPLAHANSWLEEANVIFAPQVNIFFTVADASEPFFNERTFAITSDHWNC